MAEIDRSFEAPFTDSVVDQNGILTFSWQKFFRAIYDIVTSFGDEKIAPIENDKSADTEIPGLKLNKRAMSQATIDYLIQRVTSTTELVESGILIATYMPNSEEWEIFKLGTPGPDSSGVTFDITESGQVTFKSSNVGGDEIISRIIFRVRSLAGKHKLYSSIGVR